ncbi:MAG: indole-3-glycerol phosphate synthase TrpC, partial [Candidatus Omnitrophica bacterium]|nr:indole-3-glycerol phosphate synthase TrpC [Candidatus Omnitrophota bacterium]
MPKRDVLKEIIAKKKERLILAKQTLTEEDLKAKIQGLAPARPFIEAISKPKQISLIAEIKKASPSAGVIRQDFNHVDIAKIYQEAGVQAISVLTEEDNFQGSVNFLNEVKQVTTVPVLRKDFIIEPYQVYESRYYGADAILLIADALTQDTISELVEIATGLGLDCLVEVHTERELKKVLKLKNIPLLGLNNRDLHTLEVDPKTVEKLYTLI